VRGCFDGFAWNISEQLELDDRFKGVSDRLCMANEANENFKGRVTFPQGCKVKDTVKQVINWPAVMCAVHRYRKGASNECRESRRMQPAPPAAGTRFWQIGNRRHN